MAYNNLLYRNNSDIVWTGTAFSEIYKLFLSGISNDYRLKMLYEDAETKSIAEDMLETWLVKAIAYFTDCLQDLERNFDSEHKTFLIDLSITEKTILANLMLLVWMEWNINNITQMNLALQDSDFNRHSESQNLTAKEDYANRWREQVYHLISEYTHKDISIAEWATGDVRWD